MSRLPPREDIRPDGPLRVLVADDSAVARGLLTRWVEAVPGFAVVGTAATGTEALALLDRTEPHILLLDLDMPAMDGFEALPLALGRRPDLSVLVVSSLTQRSAATALRCLELGAVDTLPKPSAARDLTLAPGFPRELAAKLQALAGRHGRGPAVPAVCAEPDRAPRGAGPIVRPHCIVIGASTGGPRALATLLRALNRAAERVPILVVQHMPPVFTGVLAEHLRTETGLAVAEARDGETVLPGQVLLAPGDWHMRLVGAGREVTVRLDPGPPVQHCRPALDVLLGDAARVYGARCIAAILTGMGCDGTDGARQLVAAGGTVIAQDETSSVVWGMPGSVVRAGLAREVLPLPAMARFLERVAFGGQP